MCKAIRTLKSAKRHNMRCYLIDTSCVSTGRCPKEACVDLSECIVLIQCDPNNSIYGFLGGGGELDKLILYFTWKNK